MKVLKWVLRNPTLWWSLLLLLLILLQPTPSPLPPQLLLQWIRICLIFGLCKDATSTSRLAMTSLQTDMEVNLINYFIYMASRHSAAERRASTRIFHLTLFLASVLISAQVILTPLASSSTVLRHVFFGLPLPRLPWGFHSRACLAMSSDDFRSVWPSHPHLRFLICKSILGWFVRFHKHSQA